MFIRQFSLRLLLAITTVCAGLSLILSFAWRGRAWAISLAVFLLVPVAILLVHGFVFWLVWLFSIAADRRQRRLALGLAMSDVAPSGTAPLNNPHAEEVIEAIIVQE